MTDTAKRNAANRRRGAQWQSDLRNGLRDAGLDVERLVLTGKEDEGDLVVRDFANPGEFVVIEAKAGQLHVTEFVRQALAEGGHFAKHRNLDRARVASIAVVKRRGMNWKDALVLTTVGDYFGLTR
ncbi:hypothetical protein V1227_19035 [Lentzea sp. DG1S-22]|uniref:hypothetical protein n=1 Tax=Lentzea sp. DG1S-22 TaxID=3108822 RepID=UPI002E78BE93|nr:hypothetical protein [Lentzea sp. DG1S-22]WVH84743.1 hypothetical protein V1227_19035 [Lentzea sp. DG1S-22]